MKSPVDRNFSRVMDNTSTNSDNDSRRLALQYLNNALAQGRDWPEVLLEAMALWTTPEELVEGRAYNYFIAGEAFDWLLLAERLLDETDNAVPQDEMEYLLFDGRLPDRFDTERIPELLGVDKYRGFLNYHYGVTVEEALQLAYELELRKRDTSNGVRYRGTYSEKAFPLIYRKTRAELLRMFRETEDLDSDGISSMAEHRAFTYWLFKYRWANSDKARIASDTTKGIRQLERMENAIWRKRASVVPVRS